MSNLVLRLTIPDFLLFSSVPPEIDCDFESNVTVVEVILLESVK
jgi:hypothetical protein